MTTWPVALVNSSDEIVGVHAGPKPFAGPDGTHHPAAVWVMWSDDDWRRACPGWRRENIVSAPRPDDRLYIVSEPGYTLQEGGSVVETWPATARSEDEVLAAGWQSVRAARDAILNDTDALLLRHQDQEALVAAGQLDAATLTADQITALRVYRQTLRDLPETFGAPDADPSAVEWPDNPLEN